MQVSLSIVITSHLSDVQSGCLTHQETNHRLNFVKWLLNKYDKENENPLGRWFEIDPDKDYKEFCEKFPSCGEPDDESRTEFDKAIKEGRLSADKSHPNYAGNYMFMGIHGGAAMFKHRTTRDYLPTPEPSN
jgi:hypothetical protein